MYSALLHLQYHDWGETLKQGTKPLVSASDVTPTARWLNSRQSEGLATWDYQTPNCSPAFHYSLLCVFTWMKSSNSEDGTLYLATRHILSFPLLTFPFLNSRYIYLRGNMTLDKKSCFLWNWSNWSGFMIKNEQISANRPKTQQKSA